MKCSKRFMMNKEKISYVLLIVLMLFSQNTVAFSASVGGYRALTRNLVYMAVLLGLVVRTVQRDRIERDLTLGFGLFVSAVLISMLIHDDTAAEYWIICCAISFFVVCNYDMHDLANKFNDIMRVLCSMFLLGYICVNISPQLFLSSGWLALEKMEIVNLHSLALPYYLSGIVPIRAYGIWREPGVYQMYAILALLICVYMKKTFSAEWIIYSLAVLTTHSTTGFMCLALVWGVVGIRMLGEKNRGSMIVLFGGIGAAILIGPFMLGSVIEKFTATGLNAHSWMSRFASFVTNIYLWWKSPVFGIGMNGVMEQFAVVNEEVFGLNAGGLAITDDTNSILIYFAAYGVIPGVLFFLGLWRGIRKNEKSLLCSLIILVMFIFLFAGEQVNNTCYSYLLIFYGLEMREVALGEEGENCYAEGN